MFRFVHLSVKQTQNGTKRVNEWAFNVALAGTEPGYLFPLASSIDAKLGQA